MICDYCKNTIAGKPLKVGPTLTFCDRDCYERDCLKRFPGTSLAKMVLTVRPDLRGESAPIDETAMMFWQKRCKRVEKQRDELIKTLEILEKIFADKDFIEEDESEDFLNHVWTLAHGALYNLKRELAQEA